MAVSARTKKTLLIALASVAGFVVLAALAWGYLVGWTVETEPGDLERGLTVQDVAEFYGAEDLGESTPVVVRTRYIDGSSDVSIDDEVEDVITSSLYSVERNDSDALGVYGGFVLSGPLVEAVADVEVQDRDDLFDWGDNSSSKVILVDGEPSGHIIVARKGKVAFYLSIGGVYETDPAQLQALIQPVLDAAERDG